MIISIRNDNIVNQYIVFGLTKVQTGISEKLEHTVDINICTNDN